MNILTIERKKLFILFGTFVGILIVIVFIAGLLSSSRRETQKLTVEVPTPTPTVSEDPQPTPFYIDKEAEDRLFDRFTNRKPLSASDTATKQTVLQHLPQGETSGVLYETSLIRIDYVASADLFQLEILTEDVELAKVEGLTWFRNQGFSQEAVCYLPVQFYLSFDILEQMKEAGGYFNPLAPGC